MSAADPAIQTVLQALDALYRDPDTSAKDKANTWLQEFQKTPEAWATSNALLLSADLPIEPRLFAAQTFRSKITFDLDQLVQPSIVSLRDTLLAALSTFATTGPRVVLTHLCLALADLAIQMRDWHDVVPQMIDSLGKTPETVPALLEFLTVLPEEMTYNSRIPITDIDAVSRGHELLTDNAELLLKTLSMYIQAQGVTPPIENQIFQCLRAWLKAGEIAAGQLAETPLFQCTFDALASDALFDAAVDVLCDLIHETQEIEENMPVIEQIVPRLVRLRSEVTKSAEDEDRLRGFCRVFTEAGETYHPLVLRHPDTFWPLVEAIAECASCHDLDIVSITFNFWYRLAGGLGKSRDDPSNIRFLQLYERLVEIIIGHLHFPDNPETQTAQERDDFRNFRHYMGDTLKDCCYVLGAKKCLSRSLDMIVTALGSGPASAAKWQDVEAPLFSMRSMGAEADPHDDEVLPRIIEVIPSLPDHPRIRYAAILVISRYTEWINLHPQCIPAMLAYVSTGFEHASEDVATAAAHAMKFMCQDCNRHLVPYLPQLHTFVQTIGTRLSRDDQISLFEAIAYIIRDMPPEEAPRTMQLFVVPLLQTANEVAGRAEATKEELRKAADALEQLEAFVAVIDRLRELPSECMKTCAEMYDVLDRILATHGNVYFVSERVCGLLRRGLKFFDSAASPVVPRLLGRLTSCFESSGFPGYLWITGKCIARFGRDAEVGSELEEACKAAFERQSARVAVVLESCAPTEISDVIEDYVHACSVVLEVIPDVLLLTSILPHAFRTSLAAFTLLSPDVILAALDFVRALVGHDALFLGADGITAPPPSPNPRDTQLVNKYPAYAQAIRQTLADQGFQLVGLVLQGLVTTFVEDCMPVVGTVFRLLAKNFRDELTVWFVPVVEQMPASNLPPSEKAKAIESFGAAMSDASPDKVKQVIQGLYRASRRSRDRNRASLDR